MTGSRRVTDRSGNAVTPPTFATLVRIYRLAARLTLHGLADASGVSVRAISDMERGRSTAPRRRTLDALAEALALDDDRRAALLRAADEARSTRRAAHPPPRDVDDFTGREAELAMLATAGGALVIRGRPGVGKTALAVHAASVHADRFPDGIHFLNGRHRDPHARLLRALGVPASGTAPPSAKAAT